MFYHFTDAKFSVWYRWTNGNVDWSISANSCGVIGANCNSAHYNVQNVLQEKRSSGRYKAEWKLRTKPLKYALARKWGELQFHNNCRNSHAHWLIFIVNKWTDIWVQNLCDVVIVKKIDVSFSWVCPVTDNEFRHNKIKIVGRSTATLTMLWRNSWSIIGQTREKLTSIC